MSLMSRLFPPAASLPPGLAPESQLSQLNAQNHNRRELLRVVLRDTLIKHGVPLDWIGGETLVADSGDGQLGLHVRLLIKHWDPRLLQHAVAFQNSFLRRAALFDPVASKWLCGISWQFALPDEAACPDMPDPTVWNAASSTAAATATVPPNDRLAQLRRDLAAANAARLSEVDSEGEGLSKFEQTQPFQLAAAAKGAKPARP